MYLKTESVWPELFKRAEHRNPFHKSSASGSFSRPLLFSIILNPTVSFSTIIIHNIVFVHTNCFAVPYICAWPLETLLTRRPRVASVWTAMYCRWDIDIPRQV